MPILHRLLIAFLLALLLPFALATGVVAQPPKLTAEQNIGDLLFNLLPQLSYKGFTRHAIGLSRSETRIYAWTSATPKDLAGGKPHVLLVGGLDGSPRSIANVLSALDWFAHHDNAKAYRERYLISAVACALPDVLRPRRDDLPSIGFPFPPAGPAYALDGQPEAHYLWRWIGLTGADLVLEVQAGTELGYGVPAGGAVLTQLKSRLPHVDTLEAEKSLAFALSKEGAIETGPIPALRVRLPSELEHNILERLLPVLSEMSGFSPSPSRKELASRAARKPLDVARQLLATYGRELREMQYIPATALVARVRFGELTKDPSHRAAVAELVTKAIEQPPKIASGSDLAGHLVLAELAHTAEGDEKAKLLANLRRAADLAFDASGRPLPSMPFHSEMSDAVFMGGPLLAATGKLTGDAKYHDACVRHLDFMHKLVLRPDGIYRHSPLDDAAWGRGNGFGALGLVLSLEHLPEDHAARQALLTKFRTLAARLKEFQDTSGMWREVIDRPGSYRELTATSMIAVAYLRGIRHGWLDAAEYRPAVERAFEAVLLRVAENGRLVDVCASTGKQKTLQDYYNRPALLGRDDRGGAMALLFAVEMAK